MSLTIQLQKTHAPLPRASLLAKAMRTSIDAGHAFREMTTGWWWTIATSSFSAPTRFDSGRSVEGYRREALRIAHGQGEIMQHAMALGLSVAVMGWKEEPRGVR